MCRIAAFLLLASLLHFLQAMSVEAKQRNLKDYQSKLKNMVGSSLDKKENCIRHVHCLTDMYSEIQQDSDNGENELICSNRNTNVFGYIAELLALNKELFLSEDCPRPFQLAFSRYYSAEQTSVCKDFSAYFGNGHEVTTEIYEAIITYVAYNKYDPTIIPSCSSISNETNDSKPIDTAEHYLGILETALDKKDYYTAKIYTTQFSQIIEDPKRKAESLRVLGDIEVELDNLANAVNHYEQSAQIYAAEMNTEGEIEALKSKATALALSNRTEELIETSERIGEIFAGKGEFNNQAAQWEKVGRYLSKAGQRKRAVSFIKSALQVYSNEENWDGIVSSKITLASNYVDMYEYQLACKAIIEFQNTAAQHNIEVSREIDIFRKHVDCSRPPSVIDIYASISKLNKLASKKEYAKALEEARNLHKLAIYAQEIGDIDNTIMSNLVGTVSKYVLLSGSFEEAENLIREALENDRVPYQIYRNLAHALYFQRKYYEAFRIYLNFAGKEVSGNTTWEQTVLEDFKRFKELEFENSEAVDLRYALILKNNATNKKLLDEALNHFNKRIKGFNTTKEVTLLELGKVLAAISVKNSRPEEGLQVWRAVLNAETDFYTQDQTILNATRYSLAKTLISTENYSEAEYEFKLLLESRKLLTDTNKDELKLADTYNGLGVAQLKQNRPEEALQNFKSAFTINHRIHGAKHTQTAISENNIGKAWLLMGNAARAIEHLAPAAAVLHDLLGEDHGTTKWVKNNLSKAYKLKKN